MGVHIAYISIGSNRGNRRINCQVGIDALIHSGIVSLIARSPFYKTEPVDYLAQGWFVNAVIKIETAAEPIKLLDRLKLIEKNHGRTNDSPRFGPRIIDLDILMLDDRVIRSSRLTIPHPRMHYRRFVLIPMCDIDPQAVHPVLKKNMKNLLDDLPEEGQKVILYR
jgi:2-amino-4-hydroxy-6-hydroxymethyldihydropteridine diphosphokinase